MGLHTEWVQYGEGGNYGGYSARPDRAEEGLPAIIVIQEIWGVDEHIQHVTRRFAEAGYLAFAPDLYADNGKRRNGLEMDRVEAVKRFLESVPPTAWHSAEERDAAMDALPEPSRTEIRTTFGQLFGGLDLEAYAPQLTATADFLRNTCEATKGQPVVSIGYCMGGGLSVRLAANDAHLAGAAIFYGSAPSDEQIAQILCPVRGFYGALDTRITDEVPGLASRMQKTGKDYAYQIYDGAHHAFFNDGRASYNANASRAAFAEVLSFFHEVTSQSE